MMPDANRYSPSGADVAGRRCLVLGAGGFIGSHLCRRLADLGADVVGLGRRIIYPEAFDPRVTFIQADLTDLEPVLQALDGVSIVFHLAGSTIPESAARDSATDVTLSVLPTLRILEACRGRDPMRFVFVSSGGAVYGVPDKVPIAEDSRTSPISAYGAAKLMIEKYLAVHQHLHGLDYAILRVANPYGPLQSPFRNQGLIATFLYRALSGQPLMIWGAGDVRRDFIHIDDVCSALVVAASPNAPRIMNVGSGVGLSVNEIAASVEAVAGLSRPSRVYMEGRPDDVPVNVLDTTRITTVTSWRPTVLLQDGLLQTADWVRAQVATHVQ